MILVETLVSKSITDLEILIPKHMWKSKIGLLEQICGQNPYDAFFLGHPVFIDQMDYGAVLPPSLMVFL